jgi:hypothetical protein
MVKITAPAGTKVLWKRYGFVHIVRPNETHTWCGHYLTLVFAYRGVLGEKEIAKRPVCGTCKKLFLKHMERFKHEAGGVPQT